MSMLGNCDVCDWYDNLKMSPEGYWACPDCQDWLEEQHNDDSDDSDYDEDLSVGEKP